MKNELVKVKRRFKHFDLLEERVTMDGCPDTTMFIYRTKTGGYIGARFRRRPYLIRFIAERGIRAEIAHPDHSVCSIGQAENGKWYGWSHRAMVGFGVGDRIFEAKFGDEYTDLRKHGQHPIRTDSDARVSAVTFASYVSS